MIPALILLSISSLIIAIIFYYLYKKAKKELAQRAAISNSVWKIDKIILNSLDFDQTVESIVNAALSELSKFGYAILVLSLIDPDKKVLKRISISKTEQAGLALRFSPIPFSTIEIPLNAQDNLNIKVLTQNKPIKTSSLSELLTPIIPEKLALEAQLASGIKESIVYPVSTSGKVVGTLIFSTTKDVVDITWYEEEVMERFVDAVGIAIENTSLFKNLKYVTDQLTNANSRLEELDKLKDDFVSVASHELRTPMTAIKSYIYMALNKGDIQLTEKMNRYLTRAYLSTERLINLVNDMLNISRIEAGRIEIIPKVIDLGYLMDDIIADIIPKAEERGVIINNIKTPIPRIFADPDKLYQIALNIIGNAIKFTPTGGQIDISFFSDGNMVDISVKDSGVGISKDDLTRLFQKFGRLNNSYIAAATSGGTGLGLYLSKRLVELMHGKIRVQSEGVNKGATFTFSLPIATSEVVNNASKYTIRIEGEVKQLEPIKI